MGMGVGYLDVEEMRSTQPDEKLVSGELTVVKFENARYY